jgi:hypothetical protein
MAGLASSPLKTKLFSNENEILFARSCNFAAIGLLLQAGKY